ncbi:hypothetical protein V498_06086 [Pseudogymnoascus sp. VKM F-4517 (FW-2822)]|nr:hypothetical protein V498_06086 [Pseudogymnoascus sp. VKM F-4517 (FW-2822)]
MSLSLYQVSVVPFISQLKIVSKLLTLGLEHVKGDESALIDARIIEDMKPLTYQIQRISDTAKGLAVRMGKVAPVAMADEEKTFPELQERIAKTIAVLESVDPKSFEGIESKEVILSVPSGDQKFTGLSYVNTFAVPNFYFHMCMVYAILRKEGVPVGKLDYLGKR